MFTPKLPPSARIRFALSALRDVSPPLLFILFGLVIGLADSPPVAAAAVFIPFSVWDFSTRQSWAGVPAIGFGISVYNRSVTQQRLPVLGSFCNRILDQVLWLTTAPTRLLTYAQFVVEIACGRDTGWATLRRTTNRSMSRHSIRPSHYAHTLFGVTVMAALTYTDSWALWWLSPVLLCWIFTIPLTLAFASRRIGALARQVGVLLTPEENEPPLIITRSEQLAKTIRNGLPLQAWHAALTQETAIAVHRAFLPHGTPLDPQERTAAASAAEKYHAGESRTTDQIELTNAEKTALLRDPERVWHNPPPPTLSIHYPAALPRPMPEQQLTRRAPSPSERAHI